MVSSSRLDYWSPHNYHGQADEAVVEVASLALEALTPCRGSRGAANLFGACFAGVATPIGRPADAGSEEDMLVADFETCREVVPEKCLCVALPYVVRRAHRSGVFEREAWADPAQDVKSKDVTDLVTDTHVRVKPEGAVIDLRVEAISRPVRSVADRHVPEKQRSASADHQLGGPIAEQTVQPKLRAVRVFLGRGRVEAGVER